MTGPDRASREYRGELPVVLPRIIATQTVEDESKLTLRFRDDRTGTDETVAVSVGDLSAAIARYAERAGTPVRMEIHAPDGTVYADILHPPAPASSVSDRAEESSREPSCATVTATIEHGGFLPGETVIVATVVARQSADESGRLVSRMDLAATPATGEVLLVGTVSSLAVARSVP